MSINYLEKVKEFRAATGLDAGQPVELHNALIREELAELADALADSVVVWCGKCADGWIDHGLLELEICAISRAAAEAGVHLDAAFNIVHESNMSKLCTPGEIEPTRSKYNALGVAVEFRQVSDNLFGCYSLGGHPGYPKGKLLKSVGYHAPRWNESDAWLL